MRLLAPRPDGRYIDATLGSAGHAATILKLTAPNGRLLGIDADPHAIRSARLSLGPFAARVTLICEYFDRLGETAQAHGFAPVHGILFDLGLSSPQLGRAERGFSFQSEGPLDMRMGPGADRSAMDIVGQWSEDDLRRILREYGEERYAARIAKRIVATRDRRPIRTTAELAAIVLGAVPRVSRNIHPATRTFQALRIAVNDELDRLRSALPQALPLLVTGGRIAVIAFHSLEDRIVKQFMNTCARGCICPPDIPECVCGQKPTLRILTRRPITPSDEEVEHNPRSRSAKLRAAEAQ